MSTPMTLPSLAVASILTATAIGAPLGPGQTMPDAALQTQDGKVVSLRELVAAQPAVLIFYRGGWCPYCSKHLAALAEIEPQILEAGHRIIAISPDQPSALAATPDRGKISYTLLSDSDAEAARAFGLAFEVPAELVDKYKTDYQIDLEAASGRQHHLLPHPAVFVVGKDGIIRFAHVNEDYKVRLEPEKILEAVQTGKP